MPSAVTIKNLAVQFGARTLFSGLDLVLADGDVTAVVGVNGSGKSSLMRCIIGELPPDEGTITFSPPDLTIGWLPQVVPDPDETLLAHVRRRTGVEQADRDLQSASEALAAQTDGADEQYPAALDRWLRLGAADLDERLAVVAAQVGLEVDPHRRLGSLSGGQAARASLISVLLSQFDVVLLDEPTNNLDARGLRLVTQFVMARQGPVLVASHDRAFLDRVATSVVELDLAQQQIGHYAGGWSDYAEAKALDRQHAREAYERYAATRDHLIAQARRRAEWAERGRGGPKATKDPDKHQREKARARADRQAGRAATAMAAVERLAEVDEPRKEWQLRYQIAEGSPSADVVASLSLAVVNRGDFSLGPATVLLARGDRVAVLGDNGSGKTTLLKALFGQLPLDDGRQQTGARVRLGWLDQERALLSSEQSVADVVRAELLAQGADPAPWTPEQVRTLLAKFGLGVEHVHRRADTLSLGERTRAMMALFQAREINTLVLDEPTNHLDVPAIEQLEQAVADFSGTLLVVSHDQRFLAAVGAATVWHTHDGQVDVEVL